MDFVKAKDLFRTWLPLIVLISLGALYFPVISEMASNWRTNDNYSHGFFVPFLSGYMVYGIRSELKSIPVQPANWGFVFILAGLGQLYVASVGSEFFLQRTSLIVVLFGLSFFLLGTSLTKELMLPIAFLIFMVPLPAIIWNKIAFPLQLFSSAITESVVRALGIPIFREGNVLHLAQTTLEVVDACSGLRSLNTMFALSTALVWFSILSAGKRWILFFSAAPVAIFANIIRLSLTAVLASMYGEKVAQGFLHDFSGLFTFAFGLFLLVCINKILEARSVKVKS